MYIPSASIGTVTNAFGFFSLSYNFTDTTKIIISYIGYETQTLKYNLQQQIYNLSLKPSILLEEIVVSAKKKLIEERAETGTITLLPQKIENIPSLGGEFDVMKVLQLMPGVKSGSEGASAIYIRGGSPDQNLMLLDDVPLYYVDHLGGFVSIFNNDALSNIKLIKGGFPAQYGNRLSSVIDIRMKEGNMQEFHGNFSLGLVSSKVSLEGPIKKNKSSFIISGRRFMYDLITRPFSKILFDGASLGYNFYDYNVKLNHKFSEKNRIYFSFYAGDDNILFNYKDKNKKSDEVKSITEWGNMLASLRWNYIFNDKLFLNSTLYYTRYRYQVDIVNRIENNDFHNVFFSGINDIGLKTDFEYYFTPYYTLQMGTNSVFHKLIPTLSQYKNIRKFPSSKLFAFENAVYLNNKIMLHEKITSIVGLRASSYEIQNTNFISIEPRILLNLKLFKYLAIKPAYSKMQQNIHLLTSSGIGLAKDIWVPATLNAKPENANQYSIALVSSLNSKQYELSCEAYFKKMNNLITYKEGVAYFSGIMDWQEKIEINGTGNSFGIETLFQKTQGKLFGWISYTWSKTVRQFNNVNNGLEYPFKYDRRHDISISATYKINKRRTFSATWVFNTGDAITLPVSKYNVINDFSGIYEDYQNYIYDEEVFIYSYRNSYRMRSYHRLDIGVNFYKTKKRGDRTFSIGLYNAYGRQNPYFYYLDYDIIYDKNGKEINNINPTVKQISFFPIIPSISYSFKF